MQVNCHLLTTALTEFNTIIHQDVLHHYTNQKLDWDGVWGWFGLGFAGGYKVGEEQDAIENYLQISEILT